MECGQCKDCRWWEGSKDEFYAACMTKDSGMIESIIHSRRKEDQEGMDTIQGIMLRSEIEFVSITSRYFGCVMFEPLEFLSDD